MSLGDTARARCRIVGISLAILWMALLANMFGLAVGKWVNNVGGLSTYAAGALMIALGAAVWLRVGPATPMRLAPNWAWKA